MAEPAETVSRDDAYAVLIGVGDYDFPEIPKLQHAVDDAKALHEALVDEARGNFSNKNVKLLIEKDKTTLLEIKRAISQWLYERTRDQPHARVLIFFAGHGDCEFDRTNQEPDGYAKYLLARDTDPKDLFNTALPNEEFTRLLKTIQAEHMVIFLDACFSGALAEARGVGARGSKPPGDLSEDMLRKLATGARRVIIAAAQSDQRSYEPVKLGHGIFTYHLLEVLAGKADSDNDGFTGVRDVFEYLRKNVPKTAEVLCQQRQQPVMRPDISADEDFRLLAYPPRLAEILQERRTNTLSDLFKKDQLKGQEYDDLRDILRAKPPPGTNRVADRLYKLLDGGMNVDEFRAARQALLDADAADRRREPAVEAAPKASAASRPESAGGNHTPRPEESGLRQEDQEKKKDEGQAAPSSGASAAFKRAFRVAWRIALALAFMGAVAYSVFFTPTVDVVVQDIDWEPQRPKVGDLVRFTARFLVEYKVREFGPPWIPAGVVEGKQLADNFTETWSVDDQSKTTELGRVLQSSKVEEARFEAPFPKPGTYRVRFGIAPARIGDSDRDNSSFTRTITVAE